MAMVMLVAMMSTVGSGRGAAGAFAEFAAGIVAGDDGVAALVR
jgi:hypothetical protein